MHYLYYNAPHKYFPILLFPISNQNNQKNLMSKSKFFNDAIAEAKVIKKTALENAKIAMAESFAPQVKNMLSSQLNEMEEELDENLEEEMSLDELLNSMEEGEDYGTNALTGEPLPKPDPIVEMDELEDSEMDGFEDTETVEDTEFDPSLDGETELTGDEEVGELTIDQFKDLVRDVMSEMDGTGEEDMEGFEDETELDSTEDTLDTEDSLEDDEEINLDEILGEMSSGYVDGSNAAAGGLDNIITQVKDLVSKSPNYLTQIADFLKGLPSGASQAMRSETVQLAEAKRVISSQSSTLKELNLLNSKLLYVNKLFKSHNLTEGVKVKVVNALDRAKTPKESENIFLALKESLSNSRTTKPLHENKGRASKPAGIAQKPSQQILTEDVDFVSRMQKLAGII